MIQYNDTQANSSQAPTSLYKGNNALFITKNEEAKSGRVHHLEKEGAPLVRKEWTSVKGLSATCKEEGGRRWHLAQGSHLTQPTLNPSHM